MLAEPFRLRCPAVLAAGWLLFISAQTALSAPANDNFSGRTTLGPALPVTASSTFIGASMEAGEPDMSIITARYSSTWWSWTAAADAVVHVKVVASLSPCLAVFTGTQLQNLQVVTGAFYQYREPFGFLDTGPVAVNFKATAGQTYTIAVYYGGGGQVGTSGTYSLSLSSAIPALNDDFAAAIVLPSQEKLAVEVRPAAATREDGESWTPHYGTMWWRWKAPVSGHYRFTEIPGLGTGRRLNVYRGSTLGSLQALGSVGKFKLSEEVYSCSKDEWIAIAAMLPGLVNSNSSGFSIEPANFPSLPANDNFAAATSLPGDSPVLIEGSCYNATAEASETFTAGNGTVWFSWSAPSSGLYRLVSDDAPSSGVPAWSIGESVASRIPLAGGGTFSVVEGSTYWFRIMDAPASGRSFFGIWRKVVPPVNDAFAARVQLGNKPTVTVGGTLLDSTTEEGESGTGSVWYEYQVPLGSRLRLQSSAADGTSGHVAATAWTGNSPTSLVPLTRDVPSGTLVKIRVTKYISTGEIPFLLQVNWFPVPVGETLAQAPTLTGASGVTESSNAAALDFTRIYGNTRSVDFKIHQAVWYKWTAPSGELVDWVVETDMFDPRIAVFAYGANSLTELPSPFVDMAGGGGSTVFVETVAGHNYLIAVGTQSSVQSGGRFRLRWSSRSPATAPPNDSMQAAALLAGATPVISGNVFGASVKPGEDHFTLPQGTGAYFDIGVSVESEFKFMRSVWYRWIAPSAGRASFVLETTGELVLRVRSWDVFAALPSAGRANVFLPVSAGQEFWIQVEGNPQTMAEGAFTLRLSQPTAPTNLSYSSPTLLPAQEAADLAVDMSAAAARWWKWTAPDAGVVGFHILGGILEIRAASNPTQLITLGYPRSLRVSAGDEFLLGVSRLLTETDGGPRSSHLYDREKSQPQNVNLRLRFNRSATPYDAWLATLPDLLPPNHSREADPDGDGLPNLIEMVQGSNPLQFDKSQFLDEGEFLIWNRFDNGRYGVGSGVPVQLSAEASSDLVNWVPLPRLSGGGLYRLWKSPLNQRFIRIRARDELIR